jgi:RNA polymerase-binding transcription factor DksA
MTRAVSPTPHPAALEQALLERRQHLLSQVTRLEADLAGLQRNVESERQERGQERALAGVLESLDEHDRSEVAAIDAALQRIRDGRYGVCDGCGEAIPTARLQVVPTATLCRACAQAREARPRR